MVLVRILTAMVVMLAASGAWAQTPADRPAWLPPGADLRAALADRPAEFLRPGSDSAEVRLGRLLFRSPSLLGTRAREIGLSCDTCHPNGGANSAFFMPGVSDRPGNVDAMHRFWHTAGDDGLDNPVNIPVLHGVGDTAPYGRDGRFPTLRGFVRHVIVDEFGGPDPGADTLDALVAYLDALAAPAAKPTGPGAALFARDCARCHDPSRGFSDGRQHDVGSGGRFDTPSLLGSAATAPYFHDGRFADLAAVVDHFAAVLGLRHSAAERADLIAAVTALGAVPRDPDPLATDLDHLAAAIDLLTDPLDKHDADRAMQIAMLLRGEAGRLHGRFNEPHHAEARAVLAGWAARLRTLGQAAADGRFAEGRKALTELRRAIAAGRGVVAAARPGSLYDAGGGKKQ